MRLQALQLSRVQRAVIESEIALPALGFGEALVALPLGAERLHPAGWAHQVLRTRVADERLVLLEAVVDQGRIGARDRLMLRGPRVVPVLPEKPGELRDGRWVVMRVDGAIDAVAEKSAEVVRKAVRVDAFALHEAGVAVRRFLG